MMYVLVFDGRMGASGDMILASLLDLGADHRVLEPIENALDVRFDIDRADRSGIESTTVDVVIDDDGNDHGHHAEGHGPHRHYTEVIEIVDELDLSANQSETAQSIFRLLGEAEASIHGTELEETHFHEVGADDAIADVVGATLLLDSLGVDRVVTTPLATGDGTVAMSHGEYPIPPPAVAAIAAEADWSIYGGPVERELLTPTGAAILGHVAGGVDTLPEMAVEATGYGGGGMDIDGRPNVLRSYLGTLSGELETDRGSLRRDTISVLETTVDDVSPEVLGGLHDRLSDVGARDVSIHPVMMKKSRPGHLIQVVCKPDDRDRIARRLAEETGTLGIRETATTHRWIADRRIETILIEIEGNPFEVDLKVAMDDAGKVYDISAEYDDVATVANETDRSIREIARLAESAYREDT